MSRSVQEVTARLQAVVDQDQAKVRDLERLLELLRPLADSRGPAWWALRRLPPEQRAEVRALLRQTRRSRSPF
jgi:hypothetical protein